MNKADPSTAARQGRAFGRDDKKRATFPQGDKKKIATTASSKSIDC